MFACVGRIPEGMQRASSGRHLHTRIALTVLVAITIVTGAAASDTVAGRQRTAASEVETGPFGRRIFHPFSDPTFTPPPPPPAIAGVTPLADGLLRRCTSAASRDDRLKACGAYLRLRPQPNALNRAIIHTRRGLIYMEQGDLEAAIDDFDEATKAKPSFADAIVNRGIAHTRNKQDERAVADFTAALRLQPPAKVAYALRAEAYVRLGDLDRAIADYTSVLKAEPRRADIYVNRAIVYARKRDFVRATADLDKALDIAPRNASHLTNRAIVRNWKGDTAGAIADLERALEIDPANAAALALRNDLRRTR